LGLPNTLDVIIRAEAGKGFLSGTKQDLGGGSKRGITKLGQQFKRHQNTKINTKNESAGIRVGDYGAKRKKGRISIRKRAKRGQKKGRK